MLEKCAQKLGSISINVVGMKQDAEFIERCLLIQAENAIDRNAVQNLHERVLIFNQSSYFANYLLGSLYAGQNRIVDATERLGVANDVSGRRDYRSGVAYANVCLMQRNVEAALETTTRLMTLFPQALFVSKTLMPKCMEIYRT